MYSYIRYSKDQNKSPLKNNNKKRKTFIPPAGDKT
jgi:hypothetical protein